MISAYADDICFAYDIPCGYDIWLRHMSEADIITNAVSNKVLPEGQVLISYMERSEVYIMSCVSTVYHTA